MRTSFEALVLSILLGITLAISLTVGPLVTGQAPDVTAKYVAGNLVQDAQTAMKDVAVEYKTGLTAQQIVYPLSDPGSAEISYNVMHNGTHIAFYIKWKDETKDMPIGDVIDQFPDAVAIQFPVFKGELPYVCMGNTQNPVNIVMWKSNTGAEALVSASAYGRGQVQREALQMFESRTRPIHTAPPEDQIWYSDAYYDNGEWMVVLIRPLGSTSPLTPSLEPGSTTSIVFAVWDGAKDERGGLKKTSGWLTVELEQAAAPAEATTQTVTQTSTVTVTAPGKGGVPGWFVEFAVVIIVLLALAVVYLLARKG